MLAGCGGTLALMKKWWTAVLVVGLLGISGCASDQPIKRGSNPNEIFVGPADAGRVIELRVGQYLMVDLPEAVSSGRVWQLLRRPDGMVLVPDGNRLDQTEAERAVGDLVSTQVLRFKAVGPGQTILSLAHVRPNTGLSTADDRWMGQIIVR